jgi:hypothetical protein
MIMCSEYERMGEDMAMFLRYNTDGTEENCEKLQSG